MTAPVPVPLVKLNLHYFPGSKIPDWLMQWELNNLGKLYIRVEASRETMQMGCQNGVLEVLGKVADGLAEKNI
ncbi:unnamed protein product [Prunus armeniaca]|uniref:Uncharacterized protein n=1 Tax=Prunus armeniaca TaxID=36596 RepID=A0A6J5UTV2_PRUAR|nr:unnamed protein product [Prunus armeniaca]CAB4310488.1 unnamed protein product [Prunus armeniaca]